jgi:hypothetical protein
VRYLRHIASGLLLLSAVTHGAQFLFLEASATNTPAAAGFGVAYLVIGLMLLLRPGRLPVWLATGVLGISAPLSTLVVLSNSDTLAVFHAVINWIVFVGCLQLLWDPSESD